MVIEDIKALLHELLQHRLFRKPGADLTAQMVVGRCKLCKLTVLPYHNMAVAGACVELKFPAVEFLTDGLHQDIGVGGGNFAGTVIQDGLVGIRFVFRQRYQVAPEDHVIRLHVNADTQGLQGRSSGEVRPGVVAHHGQVGNLTAGRHSGRDILDHAHLTFGSQ